MISKLFMFGNSVKASKSLSSSYKSSNFLKDAFLFFNFEIVLHYFWKSFFHTIFYFIVFHFIISWNIKGKIFIFYIYIEIVLYKHIACYIKIALQFQK